MRRAVRFAAVGVLTAGVCGCGSSAPEVVEERPIGVTVATVQLAPLRDVASASGVVVPAAAGEWTIYAPGPGQVARLPKKENEPVQAGDILVEFDVTAVSDALTARQAAVTEAAQRADRAKSEFVRMSDLFGRGITSRNAYEAARAEQTTSATQLSQAIAELEAVKAEQAQAIVRARFNGIVARVWFSEGEFVTGSPNHPVLQVIDPTRLQVAAELPIPQLARIVPGQSATVLAIGGEGPLPAVVASKQATVDANAPTGEVRVAFAESATLALKTPVSLEILLDQRSNALAVPAEAVRRDATGSFVMVAGEDGRAHRREVRAGLATRTLVEIVSGLTAGERVIVGGLADVSEGVAVAFTP